MIGKHFFGPRRLANLGPTEISSRLNLGSEKAIYAVLAIIAHCRIIGRWTPFTLTAVKKANAKIAFPRPIHDFEHLLDAGYVEKLDFFDRHRMERLFQIKRELVERLSRPMSAERSPLSPRKSASQPPADLAPSFL